MFYIATGSLDHMEKTGTVDATLIICLRHERPEEFSLHASFGAMSDAVLGNTYDVPASAFSRIKRDTSIKYLVDRDGEPCIPSTAAFPNPQKYDLDGGPVGVDAGIGSARQARSQYWPVLKDMSMYSLGVDKDGMREPHWHLHTGEMGYVNKDAAGMSVMDPDGSVDTYTLQEGDVYFIPAAYPHQIEVLGEQ